MVIPQIIKIRRVSAWTHNSKQFTVVLNGRKMPGRIGNGEEREIAVEPGYHDLSLKMGLLGSNTVKFEINDNNPMTFECGFKLTFWESIFPLFKMVFKPNDFLWITQK